MGEDMENAGEREGRHRSVCTLCMYRASRARPAREHDDARTRTRKERSASERRGNNRVVQPQHYLKKLARRSVDRPVEDAPVLVSSSFF